MKLFMKTLKNIDSGIDDLKPKCLERLNVYLVFTNQNLHGKWMCGVVVFILGVFIVINYSWFINLK